MCECVCSYVHFYFLFYLSFKYQKDLICMTKPKTKQLKSDFTNFVKIKCSLLYYFLYIYLFLTEEKNSRNNYSNLHIKKSLYVHNL